MALFSWIIYLMMKGLFKFWSDTIKTALFFPKISVRDNRGSDTIKTALYLGKVYFVIIGTVQIFKWHHQNCLIFVKNSTHDNRGKSKFQMTSLNPGYLCKNFNSWSQGQLKFSSECIWIALFWWTILIVIIGPVRFVIIGGGQVTSSCYVLCYIFFYHRGNSFCFKNA